MFNLVNYDLNNFYINLLAKLPYVTSIDKFLIMNAV